MAFVHAGGDRQVLEMVRRLLQQRRYATSERDREVATFTERLAKVSAPYHAKVVAQAMRAMDIDAEQLDERHRAERSSVLNFIREQERNAQRMARDIEERHTAQIAAWTERLRRVADPQPGQPTGAIVDVLREAVEVDLNGTGGVGIAPNANTARTRVKQTGWVSGLDLDSRYDTALVDFHFQWVPPRDGLLRMLTFLALNGFGYVYPGPGCVKGTAEASIEAVVTIAQASADGQVVSDVITQNIEDLSQDFTGPTYGGEIFTRPTPLDSVTTLAHSSQFPVVGAQPVAITVSVQLQVWVSHAEAELNFEDGDFRLTVPDVYVFLG